MKKKNSTTYEFVVNVIYPDKVFLCHFSNVLAQSGKYLLWFKPIADELL